MSILIGPIAFATPPVLRLLVLNEFPLAREAVVVPSANAMLLDTNPLRDEDDEDASELDEEVEGEGALMCNFAGA